MRWLWNFWRKLHAECLNEDPRPGELAAEPLLALLTAAVSLTLINALAQSPAYERTWSGWVAPENQELGGLVHWAAVTVACHTLPALCVLALQRRNPLDYGLRMRGMLKHLWIYLAMIAIMAPVVYLASTRPEFRERYPFYKQLTRSWADILIWEGCYTLQFISLEFFFRGFLLFSLRRKLGVYGIFVMMVPYCMIHFQKPTLETFAAIIAGIALGTVALATRSIWWGAGLHIAVAWSMDTLATWGRDAL